MTEVRFDADEDLGPGEEWVDTLYLGDDGARWDTRSTSTIIRNETNTYIHLDHEAKSYAEIPLPLKLEDLLTDEETECVHSHPLILADSEAETVRTDEKRVIDRWQTTRVKVFSKHALGLVIESDTWFTHDLKVNLDAYFKLLKNQTALSPARRAWLAEYVTVGGFPVESTTRRQVRNFGFRVTQRLHSIAEVEPDPDRYRPPAGYSMLERPPLKMQCVKP